ncbi:MAG: hypothetical protein E4H46_00770 [Desulfobacterales bacterium]|nr:hypothetical protein [Desulfobulbaceae bacterium]TFG37925.1 MAG: hypothetical protein E4H46_00770 [Desulfobacterales bacterium]
MKNLPGGLDVSPAPGHISPVKFPLILRQTERLSHLHPPLPFISKARHSAVAAIRRYAWLIIAPAAVL